MQNGTLKILWVLVWCAALFNALHWFSVRNVKPHWENTPPPPGRAGALAMGLGDAQLSARIIAFMLQNIGDEGGRTTNFSEYDYNVLAKWFYLYEALDPRSDFVPYLAAYYFSEVADQSKLQPVIDYLYEIGNNPEGEKFRWLGQAVFLTRYRLNDLDKAYEMALVLTKLDRPLPLWARMMPALVKSQIGEKQAAAEMLTNMLLESGENLHPNEVNSTIIMICDHLLDAEAAKGNPFCQARQK